MRLIFPLILGVLGFAVLAALGQWQLGRAAEKDALIADIEARLAEPPVPLATVDPTGARYRAVRVEGVVGEGAVAVFDTWRAFGAGVRVVVPVEAGERRVMLDLGAVQWSPGTDPETAAASAPPPGTPVTAEGNLDTPAAEDGGWDVGTLAARLDAEPVLVVARVVVPKTPFQPIPVSTDGIPDNHMGYAIQWFGLALVWLGMTLYWVWRIRRRTV